MKVFIACNWIEFEKGVEGVYGAHSIVRIIIAPLFHCDDLNSQLLISSAFEWIKNKNKINIEEGNIYIKHSSSESEAALSPQEFWCFIIWNRIA